jgi:hypothetical protein
MANPHSSDSQKVAARRPSRSEKMRLYRQRKIAEDRDFDKRRWQEEKRRDPDVNRKKYLRSLARDPDINRKKYARRVELMVQRGERRPQKKSERHIAAPTAEERRKNKIQKVIARQRQRYSGDPEYVVRMRVRSRMKYAIKACKTKKATRTLWLVGCTGTELMTHIESLFKPGMSWRNRREWHIDHIIPCSAFDLTTEQGQRAAFHYTNLQPLWARDNLRKSKKPPVAQRRFSFGYVMLADEQRTGRRREARRRKGDVPNLQPPGPAQ